ETLPETGDSTVAGVVPPSLLSSASKRSSQPACDWLLEAAGSAAGGTTGRSSSDSDARMSLNQSRTSSTPDCSGRFFRYPLRRFCLILRLRKTTAAAETAQETACWFTAVISTKLGKALPSPKEANQRRTSPGSSKPLDIS